MMKRHASLLFLAGLAFAAAIHGAEATFFAVNEDIYELHASPKDVLTFVRDKAEPSSLVGENGWMGELREGNGALLLSEDQRNGYLFVNGLLRKRLVDGREVPVEKSRPSIVGDEAVKTLWPPKAERLKADAAPRDFWAPGARLRLWFANPYLAGGLLAMGALAALGLVFCRRWRWRIAGILIAMLLLSLLIGHIPLPPATDDLLLAAIYGGAISGIGFGLVLRGSATTGGTDMLASLLHRIIPVLRVSYGIFFFDGVVIIASAFAFEPQAAMYGLISTFICNVLIDLVLEGPNSAHSYFIISDKSDAIAERILKDMDRGVTALHAMGMYSHAEKQVLLCVVNRFEAMRLRRIIFEADPHAFVIANKAHEVLGEGFKPM